MLMTFFPTIFTSIVFLMVSQSETTSILTLYVLSPGGYFIFPGVFKSEKDGKPPGKNHLMDEYSPSTVQIGSYS